MSYANFVDIGGRLSHTPSVGGTNRKNAIRRPKTICCAMETLDGKVFPLPWHRRATGDARGAPQVDMRLDAAESTAEPGQFLSITTLIQVWVTIFGPTKTE